MELRGLPARPVLPTKHLEAYVPDQKEAVGIAKHFHFKKSCMPDGSKTSLGRKYQEHFPLQSWSVSVDFKTPLRPNIKSLRLPCKYSSPL